VARLDTGAMLTHDFIFEVVLPPLLFEAALSIHWRELRRDLVVVLTLSTLGVVISALVVAAGMMHFLGWPAAPALVQRSNRRNRSHCRHRHVQGYRHQGPTSSLGRE
jgi:monovalent cation:H+ antiporter, CPA1 family